MEYVVDFIWKKKKNRKLQFIGSSSCVEEFDIGVGVDLCHVIPYAFDLSIDLRVLGDGSFFPSQQSLYLWRYDSIHLHYLSCRLKKSKFDMDGCGSSFRTMGTSEGRAVG